MSGESGNPENLNPDRVDKETERQAGMRPIAVATARIAAPLVVRRGGGVLARLKAEWPAIMGAELARAAWPEALGRDGVLKLRVAGPVVLELQHRVPLVIERINLYFGRTAVSRIVFVQGPLPTNSGARPGRPGPKPPSAAEAAAVDRRLAAIADPELRAALARLGRAVADAERDR